MSERDKVQRDTLVLTLALAWLGGALFPRTAYRLRWWTRSRRGFAYYVLANSLAAFAMRVFVLPRFVAWLDAQDEQLVP